MPTSLGPAELLVIFVVALMVLGPDKLPEVGRKVGKFMGDVRRWSQSVQTELRQVETEIRSTFSVDDEPEAPPGPLVPEAVGRVPFVGPGETVPPSGPLSSEPSPDGVDASPEVTPVTEDETPSAPDAVPAVPTETAQAEAEPVPAVPTETAQAEAEPVQADRQTPEAVATETAPTEGLPAPVGGTQAAAPDGPPPTSLPTSSNGDHDPLVAAEPTEGSEPARP